MVFVQFQQPVLPGSTGWKKYEGSLTHSTGAPLGATLLPSGRVVSSSSS